MMSQLRFRPIWGLMLVLLLAGCVTWSPVDTRPDEFIRANTPEAVVVNEAIQLRHPGVAGDSIAGTTPSGTVVRIALDDIETLSIKGRDNGNTAKAVLGGGALLGVVLLLFSCAWGC